LFFCPSFRFLGLIEGLFIFGLKIILTIVKKSNSIDDYFEEMPAEYKSQFQLVRNLIKRLIPRAIEEMKYYTPFFTYQGPFIYLGVLKKKEYVIGSCQGSKMTHEANMLSNEKGQSPIRYWKLSQYKVLDLELLGVYILEAEAIQSNSSHLPKIKKPLKSGLIICRIC
jgi:hypothetical protein